MSRIAAFLSLIVIAAYARLLPGGRWQADEYGTAASIQQHDWSALFSTLRWAPRPIGQPIAWFYLAVSNWADRPLTTLFLAILWTGCFMAMAAAARFGGFRRPVAAALILFALTLLLAATPGEMFYWPMGAAAYLPCWAALACATLLIGRPGPEGDSWVALCLLLAALTLEIGAVTALIFAAFYGCVLLPARRWRTLAKLAVPSLAAGAVCLTVLHARMQPMGEIFDRASGLAGNWPASLLRAVPAFAAEAGGIVGLPLAAGLAIKGLLLFCLPSSAPGGLTRRVAWAVALLGAAFASVVLAYHQFGTLCCGRHQALRQAMVLLALASLSGLCGTAALRWRGAVLATVIGGVLVVRGDALRADWRGLAHVVAARQRSWDSGRAAGDTMTLVTTPPGRITNGDAVPLGQFADPAPWYAAGLLGRFHKREVLVIEERQ